MKPFVWWRSRRRRRRGLLKLPNDRSLMAEDFYAFWERINHFLKAKDTREHLMYSQISMETKKKTTEPLFGVSEDGGC